MAMKNRSRFLFYNLSFIFLALLLLACSSKKNEENDNQVFRYNEHSNISSLDPAFAKQLSDIWAINQLFNGLVQLDDELNVKPDIAKKWSISENGKSYMFTLRNDVYFHKHILFGIDSTRIVNAHDFDYSFERSIRWPGSADP